MEYVLETNGLGKKYGHFTALSDVSMHIPKGAIYGFVGRNGAGKTTLIRLICGLQRPTAGRYTLFGKSHSSHEIRDSRKRLGIAIALAGNPDFLVLDEPANGLDPQGIVEMRELILKLNREREEGLENYYMNLIGAHPDESPASE